MPGAGGGAPAAHRRILPVGAGAAAAAAAGGVRRDYEGSPLEAATLAVGSVEGILSLCLPILVCMENPYKKNKWQ